MMTGELFIRLRQLYDHDHLSLCQISRVLNLNIKTVAKWAKRERWRSRPRVQRPSKLDAHKNLVVRLATEQGLSAVQILRRLREQGYAGGYTILKDYLSVVRPPRHPAFLTLAYAPGECAQVDWGHAGKLHIGGAMRRLSFLVVVLCYSRQLYVEFTLGQAMEHFLGALQRALEYFNAVPRSVLIDNMKTAVLNHAAGLPPVFHPRFLEFAQHYGFQPKACGVRQPQAKGRVENGVGYVKKSLLNGLELTGLTALNASAREWLDTVANVRIHSETREQPVVLFAKERSALLPLNPVPCDTSVSKPVRATHQFRIVLDTNRYSVPSEYASQRMTLRLSDQRLWLYIGQKLIAEHLRSYGQHQNYENPEHVRELLNHRRGALEHKRLQRFLALSSKAETFYRQLEARHLNARQQVQQIVALSEIYPLEAVARALEDATDLGAFRAEYIANILAMRARQLPEPGALHVTRRQDLLELDLPEPDLSIYEKPIKKGNLPHENQ